MLAKLAEYRKFVVALLGAAAVSVSNGTVTGGTADWVTAAVAFATALGVYAVPND